MDNVVEFRKITKYFPGVKALEDISFSVHSGEVLAFIGENGAGKSTLLKILNGDYQPTSGEYLINGEKKHFRQPSEAIEAGISVIYQERQVLMNLTIAENVFLGRLPADKFGIVNTKEANRRTAEIISDFGLDMKPTDKVKDLSIAYQQIVEIMKAYSRDNLKLIAFDEPTASLSDSEIESLFKIIRKLKSEGKMVIYISHRMEEIQEIADRIVILKDGKYVGNYGMKEVTEEEMIRMMVGRNLGDIYDNLDRNKKIGDVLLEVEHLKTDHVKDVSFTLHKGEILGFSGLVGAGRTETARGIIGADKMLSGELYLEGKRIYNKSPKDAMKNGIILIPEDRKTQGLLTNFDVGNNITVGSIDANSNNFGVLNRKKENEMVQSGIREFKIKTPSAKKKVLELSGGNQQKTIVARWMSTNPKVLILDEPTKGIDIGAKAEFYNMICKFAKQGLGVILISSELPEVMGLSDRIIVMKSREISGEVLRKDASEEGLLKLAMIGGENNGRN
ncbi:MAG TPA: sugar ABC transporter ATP-binding protein [Clostridiaceae bacterium]|jgi:L-arabinose transport system ATP-binding protein|nr:sugar ABC transporter ATP-binding protein [Clostridiaceae bacterium]HBN27486.1 sugar ABC transporter ATP-binding protein [Clostridiaceae bacterium]HCL50225.1 sugar ABC transporter ATP-binding protein [Clostridiaceae bacterium]